MLCSHDTTCYSWDACVEKQRKDRMERRDNWHSKKLGYVSL